MTASLPLSRVDLELAVTGGRHFEYLFFWGHRQRADGRVTETCFSQWYPAPFELDGDSYASAEHFMMAEKARLFGDLAIRERILAASGPDAAKSLGRKVKGFTEQRWNEARFDIVVRGNLAKFGQHEPLRRFLLSTEARVLVEASPTDTIWGIGISRDDPRAQAPAQWRGENLLGFALMAARARLSQA